MQTRKYVVVEIVVAIILVGIITFAPVATSQAATGPFNPQTEFQVGSGMVIRSVNGIATVRPHNGTGSGRPPQWNGTTFSLPTYNASLTIDAQIGNDASNGGVQLSIQGGVMVIGASTIVISGGQGEISANDRVAFQGTAMSLGGQSFNWRMEGLAALVNGAMILDLTGSALLTLNGVQTNVMVTYISTVA